MNTIPRLTLAAAVCIAATAACTLEIESDRASARRVAERAERAIERTSRELDREAAATEVLLDAIDLVVESAALDDLDDLDYAGIVDLDGDGIDDDGEFEIVVDGTHACLFIDARSVSFDVGHC